MQTGTAHLNESPNDYLSGFMKEQDLTKDTYRSFSNTKQTDKYYSPHGSNENTLY